jgi:putative hydrolase of the HAD superfamily
MECKSTYLPLNFKSIISLNLNGIENIIFDLGGVIINLDLERTEKAFLSMVAPGKQQALRETLYASDLFPDYERGNVTDEEFIYGLQNLIGEDADHQRIRKAWNAMLLDIPAERLELVRSLKNEKRVFVLSNTNQIHLEEFNQILLEAHEVADLDEVFDKAYYSHHTGYRKPEPEIFEMVLEEQELKREETLFIDDNPHNVEAASALGLQTLHLLPPDHLLNHFSLK